MVRFFSRKSSADEMDASMNASGRSKSPGPSRAKSPARRRTIGNPFRRKPPAPEEPPAAEFGTGYDERPQPQPQPQQSEPQPPKPQRSSNLADVLSGLASGLRRKGGGGDAPEKPRNSTAGNTWIMPDEDDRVLGNIYRDESSTNSISDDPDMELDIPTPTTAPQKSKRSSITKMMGASIKNKSGTNNIAQMQQALRENQEFAENYDEPPPMEQHRASNAGNLFRRVSSYGVEQPQPHDVEALAQPALVPSRSFLGRRRTSSVSDELKAMHAPAPSSPGKSLFRRGSSHNLDQHLDQHLDRDMGEIEGSVAPPSPAPARGFLGRRRTSSTNSASEEIRAMNMPAPSPSGKSLFRRGSSHNLDPDMEGAAPPSPVPTPTRTRSFLGRRRTSSTNSIPEELRTPELNATVPGIMT